MRYLLGMVIVLVLSGCDSVEMQGKSFVAQQMKDPDSAKFSHVFVVPYLTKENSMHVCGSVNAKNLFGAYTGERKFIVRIEGASNRKVTGFEIEGDDKESRRATPETNHTSQSQNEFEAKYWNRLCVDNVNGPSYSGVSWTTPLEICRQEIERSLSPEGEVSDKPLSSTQDGRSTFMWGGIMLPPTPSANFLIGHSVTCVVNNNTNEIIEFNSY